jgi:hypothetical protein
VLRGRELAGWLGEESTATRNALKSKTEVLEPILPNFIFLSFLIFVLKLSNIVIQENNAIAVKEHTLIAKKPEKMSILQKKVW